MKKKREGIILVPAPFRATVTVCRNDPIEQGEYSDVTHIDVVDGFLKIEQHDKNTVIFINISTIDWYKIKKDL